MPHALRGKLTKLNYHNCHMDRFIHYSYLTLSPCRWIYCRRILSNVVTAVLLRKKIITASPSMRLPATIFYFLVIFLLFPNLFVFISTLNVIRSYNEAHIPMIFYYNLQKKKESYKLRRWQAAKAHPNIEKNNCYS